MKNKRKVKCPICLDTKKNAWDEDCSCKGRDKVSPSSLEDVIQNKTPILNHPVDIKKLSLAIRKYYLEKVDEEVRFYNAKDFLSIESIRKIIEGK